MAPVNFPPSAPSTPSAPSATNGTTTTAPPAPAPAAARPAATVPAPSTVSPSDAFSREPWTFSPVRPQLPGENGAPRLWAMPGGTTGIGAQPSAPSAPTAPKAAPDPATSAYAQKLGDIFQASPESFARGQLPTAGPLTDQQKDKLVDATKDYLLDAKIGTLAGPAAEQVKSALAKRGIDPSSVDGKSLEQLGEGVGEQIAGDVSKGVRENPAAAGALVGAGLAAAAGAAIATANDKGLTVPQISGKIGPVTVSGQGSAQAGFKQWDATAGVKGTASLGNGRTLDVGGGATVDDRGLARGQAGATYRGPIGNNGNITLGGAVTVDRSGPSATASATIQPKAGGPRLVIGGAADSKQQNVQIGIGGTF